MNHRIPHLRVAGQILIGMIGVVLVLAGGLKLLDVGAEDMVDGLEKANLVQHRTLISVTALVCGGLLLLPLTRVFGVLMATAYWGGAIVAHLTYDDSVVMPAVFLAILWLGAGLCLRFPSSPTADPATDASQIPDQPRP